MKRLKFSQNSLMAYVYDHYPFVEGKLVQKYAPNP